MRILLLAAACFTLLATMLAWEPASAQSNCAAQRSACVALSGLRQPLLDSILPGHSDRLQAWRPERLQQRLQLLQ